MGAAPVRAALFAVLAFFVVAGSTGSASATASAARFLLAFGDIAVATAAAASVAAAAGLTFFSRGFAGASLVARDVLAFEAGAATDAVAAVEVAFAAAAAADLAFFSPADDTATLGFLAGGFKLLKLLDGFLNASAVKLANDGNGNSH